MYPYRADRHPGFADTYLGSRTLSFFRSRHLLDQGRGFRFGLPSCFRSVRPSPEALSVLPRPPSFFPAPWISKGERGFPPIPGVCRLCPSNREGDSMQKQTKKLSLSKEVLRALNLAELKEVPGGIVSSDNRLCMNQKTTLC